MIYAVMAVRHERIFSIVFSHVLILRNSATKWLQYARIEVLIFLLRTFFVTLTYNSHVKDSLRFLCVSDVIRTELSTLKVYT